MIEALLQMVFGFSADRSTEYLAHMGTEAFSVVRNGSRLAACAALLETRQRFGGNWIPAANIAHVAIAPEARAQGSPSCSSTHSAGLRNRGVPRW